MGTREPRSTYSLAQWSALPNGDLITLNNTESWRNVRSQVLVSLLISGVLGDEVEVFSADDERAVHLGGDNGAGQDTATDRDKAGERALLVCINRMLASILHRPRRALWMLIAAQHYGWRPLDSPLLTDQNACLPEICSRLDSARK